MVSAADVDVPQLRLERVTRVVVDLGSPLSVGPGPWGERRVIPIAGGRFDGPVLTGAVLPGGADWQVIHADGAASIDTRYTLRTHDGATIFIATRGVRCGEPETLARLARGEAVDPSAYYFRVSVLLETGSDRYSWVNRRVFVASAARLADAVVYDMYALT
ncbi:MAG: DUF3237 domain-containing protein [Nocardioidaceae bacterium]